MADREIGSLPAAAAIYNEDIFVLEQNGAAKKLSGELLKLFSNATRYETVTTLPATGEPNVIYLLTSGSTTTMYVYSGGAWQNVGTLNTTAGDATPLMDGTASPGSATQYSRQDHRHPTDTNRAADNQVVKHVAQTLTDSQKAQARENIGAISANAWAKDAWNQLVEIPYPNGTTITSGGVSITYEGNGQFLLNGTATSNLSFRIDQKNFAGADNLKTYKAGKYFIGGGNFSTNGVYMSVMENFTYIQHIITMSGEAIASLNSNVDNCFILLRVNSGVTVNNVRVTPQLVYLTPIFGAGNEPTTASEFRSMFPANYYPYYTGGFGDLLWENASPTSAFALQDVKLDISKYSFIAIECCLSTSNTGRRVISFFAKGKLGFIFMPHMTNQYRIFNGSNNSTVFFGDGKKISTYGGAETTDNSIVIPVAIYGIR